MADIKYLERNIAITDIETTGLLPEEHEIISIGLILVKQPSLEIIEKHYIKVKPININKANPDSLKLNGYNAKEWEDAKDIKSALQKYFDITKGAIFSSYNIWFDYNFIQTAAQSNNVQSTLDYHCIDIPSIVWSKLRNKGLNRINLNIVAANLGLQPEPEIHNALNGATVALEVLKKINSI